MVNSREEDKMYLYLLINRISFLKAFEKLKVVEHVSSTSDIAIMGKDGIEALLNRRIYANFDFDRYRYESDRDFNYLVIDRSVKCVFYWEENYPPQLREIYNPPYMLFYRGTLPDWSQLFVTVVGTRHASVRARHAARRIASNLASSGVFVVSGLARGIDAEAHIGSLVSYGRAIAVMGSGVDTIYPVSNRWIAVEMLKKRGVIFSEYPPTDPPLKYHFPERNRILSGLSRMTIVIEAPLKSGALITADYALEQGRDVAVHFDGLKGSRGDGTRRLADEGAYVIRSSSEIFNLLGIEYREKENDINQMEDGLKKDSSVAVDSLSISQYLSSAMKQELLGMK